MPISSVAIVGLEWGKSYVSRLKETGIRVVAVSSRREQSQKQFIARQGLAPCEAVPHWEKLLGRSGVNAVFMAIPNELHFDAYSLVLDSVLGGKSQQLQHYFLEGPLLACEPAEKFGRQPPGSRFNEALNRLDSIIEKWRSMVTNRHLNVMRFNLQLRYLPMMQQLIANNAREGLTIKRITVEILQVGTKWPPDWCEEAVRCGGLPVYYWIWYLDCVDAILNGLSTCGPSKGQEMTPQVFHPVASQVKNKQRSGKNGDLVDIGHCILQYVEGSPGDDKDQKQSRVAVDLVWSFAAPKKKTAMLVETSDGKTQMLDFNRGESFGAGLGLSIQSFLNDVHSFRVENELAHIERMKRVHQAAFLCGQSLEQV